MRPIDWIVLAGTIGAIVVYGIWLGRRRSGLENYMLAGRSMPWWMVMASVMATQASATTFLSIPGQGFGEGLRFVQFYFGLPFAMIVLAITAIPIFHKLHVYTAYEYLEKRFDKKTRTLAALLFLVMRGFSTGLTIYTPALVFSVLLGWDITISIFLTGGLAVLYTAWGGSAAVGRTQSIQFLIIIVGMAVAFVVMLGLLPKNVTFSDAWAVADVTNRTRALDFSFNWKDQFTFWSGLIGGFFLQMSYFGADQSQVGRYLGGSSIRESRLGLLFNGLLKIPMQFGILIIGLTVFSVYHFIPQPLYFNSVEVKRLREGPMASEFHALEISHQTATALRRSATESFISLRNGGGAAAEVERARTVLANAEENCNKLRARAQELVKSNNNKAGKNDWDYVFLTFVLDQLPAGVIGLILAGILCAAMSATSAQFNALAAASVIDIYKNIFVPNAGDAACLRASRIATIAWGAVAVGFAQFAGKLGNLVVAVNVIGSLFYGTMLGIFLVAFYLKRVGGTAVYISALVSEVIVILLHFSETVSFLWYNVAGCGLVVVLSLLLSIKKAPATISAAGADAN